MKSWQVLLDFANELLTQDTSLDFSPALRGSDKVVGEQVGSAAKRGCPILRVFCEGWDLRQCALRFVVSHPRRKNTGKDGAPADWLHFPLSSIKRLLSIALHCRENAG